MEDKKTLELQALALDLATRKQQNSHEEIYNRQEMLRRNLEVLISLRKLVNLDMNMIKQLDDKISQIITNLSI